MLQLAHTLAAWIGVEETLLLFSFLSVLFFLGFTRRLGRQSGWAQAIRRLAAFAPLVFSCLLVFSGWNEHLETMSLLQSTDSLSETQANLFWRESYVNSASTIAYGLLATCVLAYSLRGTSRAKSACARKEEDAEPVQLV